VLDGGIWTLGMFDWVAIRGMSSWDGRRWVGGIYFRLGGGRVLMLPAGLSFLGIYCQRPGIHDYYY